MRLGLAGPGQGPLSPLLLACSSPSLVPQLGLSAAADEAIPNTLEDEVRTPPRGAIDYSEERHTLHVLLLNSRSLLGLQILLSQESLALFPGVKKIAPPTPVIQTRLDLKEQAEGSQSQIIMPLRKLQPSRAGTELQASCLGQGHQPVSFLLCSNNPFF